MEKEGTEANGRAKAEVAAVTAWTVWRTWPGGGSPAFARSSTGVRHHPTTILAWKWGRTWQCGNVRSRASNDAEGTRWVAGSSGRRGERNRVLLGMPRKGNRSTQASRSVKRRMAGGEKNERDGCSRGALCTSCSVTSNRSARTDKGRLTEKGEQRDRSYL